MEILDYLLHIDIYLEQFLVQYHQWFYLILFILIFIETGVVVMPFLPGDSLLFASGMLAAAFPNELNIFILLLVLWVAAILGDTTNYTIGNIFGDQMLRKEFLGKRIIKDKDVIKTQSFFIKYGAKTIVIARFIPIVRTLAPFVAGISKMHYNTFIKFNIIGGTIWVFALTLAGYFLGTIPFVNQHFELMVLLIIALSLFPILFELIKTKFQNK